MNDSVIQVENLGKKYIIGHERPKIYNTLRDVITNKARLIVNKTRLMLRGGQLITGNELEDFWALKDVNFEINRGEVVGIIGKNGAGKSTLLKILSRITEPTKGRITLKGRVACLLEVGTGFSPELSGRENIFLNGAILGMSQKEIRSKFDEIVDFSGVEKFLDTPVKRYSSGMYVRLAFAVAAHLESEILIIDEVLAVGDAEFQKKCMGKMKEISSGQGRTLLFVSHNMAAVQNLCSKAMLLNNGSIQFQGSTQETIEHYLETNLQSNSVVEFIKKSHNNSSSLRIQSIKLLDAETQIPKSTFKMGENLIVELRIISDTPVDNVNINIRMNDQLNNHIAAWRTNEILNETLNVKKELISRTLIKSLNVFDGLYSLSFAIIKNTEKLDYIENGISFEIIPASVGVFGKAVSKTHNLIYTPSDWEFINN